MTAVAQIMPDCVYRGCYFHFCQCLWRNIQDKGLVHAYKTVSTVRQWLHLFKSLALVPLALLDSALLLLNDSVPPGQHLQACLGFMCYFRKTWKEKYEPSSWNHSGSAWTPRTNNHVEGFNNSLKVRMRSSPDIYEWISHLKVIELQHSVHFIRRTELNVAPKRYRAQVDMRRDNQLQQLFDQLASGEKTLDAYMRAVSYLFSYDKS